MAGQYAYRPGKQSPIAAAHVRPDARRVLTGDNSGESMALSIGIVGLPNVGKSTLFNALTKAQNAQAANYPFCTI